MTTGWLLLLLLLVVSSQSVDGQSTTGDEVCDGMLSESTTDIIQTLLENQLQLQLQLQTVIQRLGKS